MFLSLHTAGMVHQQKEIGGIEKPWGMAGFSGFKVGEIEQGIRGDEMMVRLMSDLAQTSWRRVYELADSVTRVDLQVTVEMYADCQDLVWDYYRRACKRSEKKKRGPNVRVWLDKDGGATLYCGDRTSARFGRVYAKGPQSRLDYYKTCLRFEVQYNGKLSKVVSRKLYSERRDSTFAVARSVQFFQDRIGQVPIRTANIVNDSCPRKRSDTEKKLAWLREAVSPSVKLLVHRGLLEDVVDALGLREVFDEACANNGPTGPSKMKVR